MMTKKDFTLLADALAMSKDLNDAVFKIADVCAASNGNFRRAQFLAVVRDGNEQVGE